MSPRAAAGAAFLLRWMVPLAALAWLAALAYSSLAARSLYGDGAVYVLIHFQVPHKFDDYDAQRSFASFITQAPILFAERLGADRVSVYAALYSLGLFVLPALALLWSLWLLRAQPVAFALVAAAAVVFGFGVSYINSEANLFFGLAWLAAAILALDRPAPLLRGFVLPALAVAMLRIYEGMMLAGPVLAAWSLLAMQRDPDGRERAGLTLAALLFALGAAIGLGGYLSPRDAGNAAGFSKSLWLFLGGPHVFLLVAAVLAAAAIGARTSRAAIVLAVASAVAGAVFLAGILRIKGYYGYIVYYDNRAFLALALAVALAGFLTVYALRPSWLASAPPRAAMAAFLVPLAFAVASDLVGTTRWLAYVHEFCAALAAPGSPAERFARLKHSGALTGWSWTHPTLSVLLRPRGSDGMVANEPGAARWEPFPHTQPPAIGTRGLCEAPLLGSAR